MTCGKTSWIYTKKHSTRYWKITILCSLAFFLTLTRIFSKHHTGKQNNILDTQHHQNNKWDASLPRVTGIFFGVLTCQKYADVYAQAVHNTWGRLIDPSMIRFFSDASHPTLPVVVCPSTDISKINRQLKTNYQKQKHHKETYFREESNRSLQLFAWAFDHFPHAKWFYKCDDDSFVRVEMLNEILQHFDPSQPLYFGSTRRFHGKLLPVLDSQSFLAVETFLRYAMGGAGYVLSRGLLEKLRPLLHECVVYNGEDKTMAKCIFDSMGIEPTNLPGFCYVHPDDVDPVSRDSMIAFHHIRGQQDATQLFKRFYLGPKYFDSGGDIVP
eukprot:jgi/Galph1/4148/GphlegSOOS_G2824.1